MEWEGEQQALNMSLLLLGNFFLKMEFFGQGMRWDLYAGEIMDHGVLGIFLSYILLLNG